MKKTIVLPTTFAVTCHTDFVGKGSTFVAINGQTFNGVSYIKDAVAKGAQTVVIQEDNNIEDGLLDHLQSHKVSLVRVGNVRKALAILAAQALNFPATKLKIIAITGTKGKTTTSFLLRHILQAAGYKTALLSSAGNYILDARFDSPLTTPQPDYIHHFLNVCVENGVEYVVMEVAAQALSLHRVEGLVFDGIIFTNFSHEHLEFYQTMDDYFAAKAQIFSHLKPHAPAVINGDDNAVMTGLHSLAKTSGISIATYGFGPQSDNAHHNFSHTYQAQYTASSEQYIQLSVGLNNAMSIKCPSLFGSYNGYNVLAAVSMALRLLISAECIVQALHSFTGVPGRLQYVPLSNGAHAYIDYAHNPSSFEAVFSVLRQKTDNLIVLFGAGGSRDKTKRPVMGAIAVRYADAVILTSDNPRFEDPSTIVDDICAGIADEHLHKVHTVLEREEAINFAYQQSRKNSIIALLGKGPDEYQIIGTQKFFFSEQAILQQL